MSDVLTPAQRSFNMSRIRAKNTNPELEVKKILKRIGCSYRSHVKTLQGKPDFVISKNRKIIMVHGCFWHKHNCKYGKVKPKNNSKFWAEKRTKNHERDLAVKIVLNKAGWKVLILWECELRKGKNCETKIRRFLKDKTA